MVRSSSENISPKTSSFEPSGKISASRGDPISGGVKSGWVSPPEMDEYAKAILPFSILEKYTRDPSVRSVGNRSTPTSPGNMESDEVICVNGRSIGLTDSAGPHTRMARTVRPIAAAEGPATRQGIPFQRRGSILAGASSGGHDMASCETTAVELTDESWEAPSSSCTGAINRYPRFDRVS